MPRRSIFIPVALFLAISAPLSFAPLRALAAPPPLPVQSEDGKWGPLSAHEDSSLEGRLSGALQQEPLWQSLISEEKLAVGVVDLSSLGAPRFAQVNGKTMMYAASLAKIAILLAAFRAFEDGTLTETPEIHQDLRDMIRRSNNDAANRMIERIGLSRIKTAVTDPELRFYVPGQGGGIWLGRRYSNRGEIIPDPLKGLVHAANVNQVCRFYYLLTMGRIISRERSRQMLEILSSPEIHDKFVSVMAREVPREHLYRKSGSWQVWHSDSVLVWDDTGGKYILAAMVESKDGEDILRQLVPIVQQLLNLKESPPFSPN